MNKSHCCEAMEGILERGQSTLIYRPITRSYSIREVIVNKKTISIGASNRITFCPSCASKLPEPLFDKIDEVLEKEHNLIDAWSDDNKNKIPAEFLTDEWWKKRGL
ncbi:MAG TPA: hypothetical protein VGW78_00045 [Candidatus Babeliales bacterium]|jgi:hypothetical protein|nr:hypothetical protein [Candidatus Babeliales bacterium]